VGVTQAKLTTRERLRRMYEHRAADRVPIVDTPWDSTIARWEREGLPANVDWADYLGMDRVQAILPDNSPRFPVQMIEATDEFRIYTTMWGATRKDWYASSGALGYLDYVVQDPESWAKAKARMQPSRDRVNWADLERNYARWRERGDWINGVLWFGFEVIYSHMVGEALFVAMAQRPEWVIDMVDTMLDLSVALLEMVWDAGYRFDGVMWYNDMGYKHAQFMSLKMYRELFKPADRRAAEWARSKGLPVAYHSCGDVTPFVPELIDVGVDMLNPLEVKAGMDPLALKARYGHQLAFHGGLNATCYAQPEAMWAEMERVIPVMKEQGGYVIGTDHSIPDSVSLEQYSEFVARAKELGRYN
jgi:uroporphyrinogen decarboxylase